MENKHKETAFGMTFDSLGTIDENTINDIKTYNNRYKTIGVDYEHFLAIPQLVKVHSIYDNYVESILGSEAYNELIPSIESDMDIHQCHWNAGWAGDIIDCHYEGEINVYYCGGFFGDNCSYDCELGSHCILYIEKDGNGAFIDPTQLVSNRYVDTFQLFYFAPIFEVIDLFDDYEQAFNPIFGYTELGKLLCN